MPGVVASAGQPGKRKRVSSSKKPSKRARSESSEEDGQAQILLLETEIFESTKNYNNVATLIKILKTNSEDADDSVIAAISLCRVFTRFIVAGDLANKKDASDQEAVVVKWLKERYTEYKNSLFDLLGEEGISATALALCMRLLKTEGENARTQEYQFPSSFLTGIVQALTKPESDANARKEFSEKFVEEYDDIRFYTFEAIKLVEYLDPNDYQLTIVQEDIGGSPRSGNRKPDL
jgi:U3 small nucleolar RNA-associated protein 19